LRLK